MPSQKAAKTALLDLPQLESWLWEAACVIRGPIDAPKFKDYILPLIFLKRLSDVFDDEVQHLAAEFGSEKNALKLVGKDHKLVRFFIPPAARWSEIAERQAALMTGKVCLRADFVRQFEGTAAKPAPV